MAAVLSLFLLAATACLNDLTPRGSWSAPVPEDEFVYLGNRDGELVRVTQDGAVFDNTFQFPPDGEDDVGEIYGAPVISNGIAYGAGYTCRGNNCDGEIFAVDIATGRSAWRERSFQIETKLVGQVAVTDDILLVGTDAVSGEEEPPGFLKATGVVTLQMVACTLSQLTLQVAIVGGMSDMATLTPQKAMAFVGLNLLVSLVVYVGVLRAMVCDSLLRAVSVMIMVFLLSIVVGVGLLAAGLLLSCALAVG